MTARFFLPLAGTPFEWFSHGGKRWELRGYGPRFNPKQLTPGKRIELRRGYSSKDRLWGVIGQHVVADSIDQIFEAVDFRLIVPTASTREEAADSVATILGHKARYIAFEVALTESSAGPLSGCRASDPASPVTSRRTD